MLEGAAEEGAIRVGAATQLKNMSEPAVSVHAFGRFGPPGVSACGGGSVTCSPTVFACVMLRLACCAVTSSVVLQDGVIDTNTTKNGIFVVATRT